MPIDAFVLRFRGSENEFLKEFLSSKDFDVDSLKSIIKENNLRLGRNRSDYIDSIISFLGEDDKRFYKSIIRNMVGRRREWVAFCTGNIKNIIQCADATEILFSRGEEQWYGPLEHPSDQESFWYVRPVYIKHWEQDSKGLQEYSVRWLFFARISRGVVSFHWRGFTYNDNNGGAVVKDFRSYNNQFPYWEYVPSLIKDFEMVMDSRLDFVQLHELVLYKLWDMYQYDDKYQWRHQRIRAEAGGVALSAHAGYSSVFEMNLEDDSKGIAKLATTIRKAMQKELLNLSSIDLPKPDHFDHVILRTLIREYGALSYEFQLLCDENLLFRAHSYFGSKVHSETADSFPHMRLYISRRSDIEQVDFICEHLKRGDYDGKSKLEQGTMF